MNSTHPRSRSAYLAAVALSLALPASSRGAADADAPAWERPLLLGVGVGWHRWRYDETFERAGEKPFLLREVFSAPGIELFSEYAAERWTLFISAGYAQVDPWVRFVLDASGDFLLAAWDRGSFGLGPGIAGTAMSSVHSARPIDGDARYTDGLVLAGAVARADHWVGRNLRVEARVSALALPAFARRYYNEGTVAPPGSTKPAESSDLSGIFSINGDVLLEANLGSLQVVLDLRGETQTYSQTALYVTGQWKSRVSGLAWTSRLLIAQRF